MRAKERTWEGGEKEYVPSVKSTVKMKSHINVWFIQAYFCSVWILLFSHLQAEKLFLTVLSTFQTVRLQILLFLVRWCIFYKTCCLTNFGKMKKQLRMQNVLSLGTRIVFFKLCTMLLSCVFAQQRRECTVLPTTF